MALNISTLAPAIGNTSNLMSRFNTGTPVNVSAKLRELQNDTNSQMPNSAAERITSAARTSASGESGAIVDTTDAARQSALTTARMNDLNNDPTLNNSTKAQIMHENMGYALQSVANNEQRVRDLLKTTG